GANLMQASLPEADLTGANLQATILVDANLAGARLGGADLTDADLTRANLADADLANASLRGADLTEASLAGAGLQGAIYDRKTRWPEAFVPAPYQKLDAGIRATESIQLGHRTPAREWMPVIVERRCVAGADGPTLSPPRLADEVTIAGVELAVA